MKTKIGHQKITRTQQVLDDIQIHSSPSSLKDGFSFLLRVKDEACTIERCIRDIVDLADEIIVVDNLSTDGTLDIIKALENEFDHVFLYQYNLQIPPAGQKHIDNYLRNDFRRHNTLKNYYNWTLSKASYKNVVKWDGDFFCIKKHLKEVLDFAYHKLNDNIAIFFSGITCFVHDNQYYLKKINHYNEYRIFSKYHGFAWDDSLSQDRLINVCETSWTALQGMQDEHLHIYSKPVFFEIKNTSKDEFSGRSTLFNDGRDQVDYRILNHLKNGIYEPCVYHTTDILKEIDNFLLYHLDESIQSTFIHEFRNKLEPEALPLANKTIIEPINQIFFNVFSLGIGGAETITEQLVSYLNRFHETHYLVPFETDVDNYVDINYLKQHIKANKDKHIIIICASDIFQTKDLIEFRNHYNVKFIGIVHSDVSFHNKYFMANAAHMEKIIVINHQTYTKYKNRGIHHIELLKNNLSYTHCLSEPSNQLTFKLLFFSRISDDKNLIMLLYAIKNLSYTFPRITLDIYATPNQHIENYIELLNLKDHILMKGVFSGCNKTEIYREYDACILPSVSEGVSLNILESINAEIPIICTNIAPNRDIVHHLLPMFDFGELDQIAARHDYIYDYNNFLEYIGYVFWKNQAQSPYIYYDKEKIPIFSKNIVEITRCITVLFENYPYYQNNTKRLKELLRTEYFDVDEYHRRFYNVLFGERTNLIMQQTSKNNEAQLAFI